MITKEFYVEIKNAGNLFANKIEFQKYIQSEYRLCKRGTWRKIYLALTLRVVKCSDSIEQAMERLENSISHHGVDWDMLGREHSVDEIEKNAVMNSHQGFIPPFGYLNSAWEEMKSSMHEGDKIYDFSSDSKSWKKLGGQLGFCLVRGNEIRTVMTLLRG